MNINYMFLMPFDAVFVVIVLFGLLTSYTDIKEGKIKNLHVLLLLVTAVLVNIFVAGVFVEKPLESLVNFVVAALLSFGMYYRNLWSEGDAKLFSVFALLIPVTSYVYYPLSFFPALNILINTFVPAALFFVLAVFKRSNIPHIKDYIKNSFSVSNLARNAFFLFGFVYIIGLASNYLHINLGPFFTVLLLVVMIEILGKINKNSIFYLSIVLSGLHIFLGMRSFNVAFFLNFVLMLILFTLLRFLVSISEIASYKKVKSRIKEKISLKTPFAPFLFFGVLFSYLTGADVFFVMFFFFGRVFS